MYKVYLQKMKDGGRDFRKSFRYHRTDEQEEIMFRTRRLVQSVGSRSEPTRVGDPGNKFERYVVLG